MRQIVWIATLLVLLISPAMARASTSADRRRPTVSHPGAQACQRHDPVGFFTAPEVLGELSQVYASCSPQPTCVTPTDLETIQIDGYSNFANWLWTGSSTTLFNVSQQDALISNAVARAGLVTPAGKVITSISFLRDIITANSGVVYVMYFTVTFARCPLQRSGMTWKHTGSDNQIGTVTVGCNGCDPYNGDTPCTQQMPLLCIYKPTPAFTPPISLNNSDQYNLWAGGVIATSRPVAGSAFANTAAADAYCVAQFGANWRVAEFHEGWGWNFQAYGGTVSAPTVPSSRFWVYINDQPLANCW